MSSEERALLIEAVRGNSGQLGPYFVRIGGASEVSVATQFTGAIMTSPIPGFTSANHSWSPMHKDYDSDGRVSFDEFMAPIPKGETGVVEVPFAEIPPDLVGIVTEESQRLAGTQESLENQFKKFDSNQDGYLDSSEIGEVSTSMFAKGKTYLQDLATYGSPEAVADAYSKAAKAAALLVINSATLDVKA